MKKKILLPLLGLFTLALGSLVALFLAPGFIGEDTVERPACQFMSLPEEVDLALSQNQEVTRKIQALDADIRVEKTVTCQGERAIITITYPGGRKTFEQIGDIINSLPEGYGASVEVVKAA